MYIHLHTILFNIVYAIDANVQDGLAPDLNRAVRCSQDKAWVDEDTTTYMEAELG